MPTVRAAELLLVGLAVGLVHQQHAEGRSSSTTVQFGAPVIVHGAWNDSAGFRRDGNESMMDSFHSLGSDYFMFGQAIPSNVSDLSPGEAVYVASTELRRQLAPRGHPQPGCGERLGAKWATTGADWPRRSTGA